MLNWIKILKFVLFCSWKFGVAFNKMAIKKMLKASLALVNHAQQNGKNKMMANQWFMNMG